MGNSCCSEKSAVVKPGSPPPRPDPLAMERFSDLAFSRDDPSTLIEGYEREPLVTLEEALGPFEGDISGLAAQIADAKRLCRDPSNHGLTKDESAAIYLYSMKNSPDSVYGRLQQAWRLNDQEKMKPWFKYLRLFYSGVNKCPNATGEIWQSVPHTEALEQQLKDGPAPIYTCMGSGAPGKQDIKEYLYKKHGTKLALIGYKNVQAKDISDYTADGIGEFFLTPGLKLSTTEEMEISEDGHFVFHLSGKTKPEPPKPGSPVPLSPRDVLIKHFICPTKHCGNSCKRSHQLKHCTGFEGISHRGCHHCVLKITCVRCTKELTYVLKCKKCFENYCDDCCFKEMDTPRKQFLNP